MSLTPQDAMDQKSGGNPILVEPHMAPERVEAMIAAKNTDELIGITDDVAKVRLVNRRDEERFGEKSIAVITTFMQEGKSLPDSYLEDPESIPDEDFIKWYPYLVHLDIFRVQDLSDEQIKALYDKDWLTADMLYPKEAMALLIGNNMVHQGEGETPIPVLARDAFDQLDTRQLYIRSKEGNVKENQGYYRAELLNQLANHDHHLTDSQRDALSTEELIRYERIRESFLSNTPSQEESDIERFISYWNKYGELEKIPDTNVKQIRTLLAAAEQGGVNKEDVTILIEDLKEKAGQLKEKRMEMMVSALQSRLNRYQELVDSYIDIYHFDSMLDVKDLSLLKQYLLKDQQVTQEESDKVLDKLYKHGVLEVNPWAVISQDRSFASNLLSVDDVLGLSQWAIGLILPNLKPPIIDALINRGEVSMQDLTEEQIDHLQLYRANEAI